MYIHSVHSTAPLYRVPFFYNSHIALIALYCVCCSMAFIDLCLTLSQFTSLSTVLPKRLHIHRYVVWICLYIYIYTWVYVTIYDTYIYMLCTSMCLALLKSMNYLFIYIVKFNFLFIWSAWRTEICQHPVLRECIQLKFQFILISQFVIWCWCFVFAFKREATCGKRYFKPHFLVSEW